MEGSKKIPMAEMPFYQSMMKAQEALQLETSALSNWQFGFKASPASCGCGHEWSVYDLMLESIGRGQHSPKFFTHRTTNQIPDKFQTNVFNLTCPSCGMAENVDLLYNYGNACSCAAPPLDDTSST